MPRPLKTNVTRPAGSDHVNVLVEDIDRGLDVCTTTPARAYSAQGAKRTRQVCAFHRVPAGGECRRPVGTADIRRRSRRGGDGARMLAKNIPSSGMTAGSRIGYLAAALGVLFLLKVGFAWPGLRRRIAALQDERASFGVVLEPRRADHRDIDIDVGPEAAPGDGHAECGDDERFATPGIRRTRGARATCSTGCGMREPRQATTRPQ